MGIKQDLETTLRAQGRAQGVVFDQLSLGSAEAEISLLEQIELNYPSKTVTETIPVTYADPFQAGVMRQGTVTRTYQAMMNDAEVIEYRAKQAAKLLSEYYEARGTMPEGYENFMRGND